MGLAVNRAASAGMEAMSPGISLQISHPLQTDDGGEPGRGAGKRVAGVPTAQTWAQHRIYQQKRASGKSEVKKK